MRVITIILISVLTLCARTMVFGQSEDVAYSVFLIGDAGEPNVGDDCNMKLLKAELDKAGANSAIVFLGDNIYPKGMPAEGHDDRAAAERSINGQLKALRDYQGKIFFVAGNHDWEKGKEEGYQRVLNQEVYVEQYLNRGNVFQPDLACPGPVEITLGENLVLILYDSQWMLHEYDKPNKSNGCRRDTKQEVLEAIATALERNKGKQVILAAHHPIFTYGIHGGVTTFKDHLFPLTELNDALYIPLPGIGSIYPLYRKAGHIQDTNHDEYKAMTGFLIEEFEKYPGLIHAAGHEHSLQYSFKSDIHYIVSGSGIKTTHVRKRGYAQYVEDEKGFAKLLVLGDGQIKLQFWQPDDENGKVAYEKILN